MPTQMEVSCARSRVTYAAGNRRLDNIFSIPYRIPLLNLLSHQHLLHYHSLLVFPHALTSAFFSFYFHYPMASSIPLYQPTNTLFSNTQVPISSLFVFLQSESLPNLVFFLNSSKVRAVASCGDPVTRLALVLKTEHDPSKLRLVHHHFPCLSLPKLKKHLPR